MTDLPLCKVCGDPDCDPYSNHNGVFNQDTGAVRTVNTVQYRVGVIGYGYVGKAVAKSFPPKLVHVYDINKAIYDKDSGINFLENSSGLDGCDAIFVCVPTPSNEDGSADVSILDECVTLALQHTELVIVKSTAPPYAFVRWPNTVVYMPEFLRAAHAEVDYAEQKELIAGLEMSDPYKARRVEDQLTDLFRRSLFLKPLLFMPRRDAVILKYTHNVALATKVALMNEMYGLAKVYGADWNNVVRGLQHTNVGSSHTKVPGPDGKRGFGGLCFPKDLKAVLFDFARLQDLGCTVQHPVLQAVKHWSRDE